jgi:hydrogenase expression/formation protein HypC
MCLAVPGKIVEISETVSGRVARVEFGGVMRPVQLDFIPEAAVGDYVVTHVGFAISLVDAEEAARTMELLNAMGLLQEEGLAAS